MFCSFNSSVAIWIIGSSIAHWAHNYAVKSSQSNLGLRSANILWHGIRGMVWEHLRPTLDFLLLVLLRPRYHYYSLGGNNIGQQHNTLKGTQMMMKAVLAEIKERLPNSMIIWFHILQRRNWSNVIANLEGGKCRRRIHSSIATFILEKLGGSAIGYSDISANQGNLFRYEWAYLTDFGNTVFIGIIKGVLKHILSE